MKGTNVEPRPDYTDEQLQAFRVALRTARGTVTLDTIADKLGYKSRGTPDHWEKDGTPPGPPVLFALENMLRLRPGELSQHLGLLPMGTREAPCTVGSALVLDPELTDDEREILRGIYAKFTHRSEGR